MSEAVQQREPANAHAQKRSWRWLVAAFLLRPCHLPLLLVALGAGVSGGGEPVQPGDTVFGSDHGEIGTVEKVVAPSDDTAGYLVVPRGVIFEKDSFIPLDAVVKRAGAKVFVNVPKLIVAKMPWDAPPSRQDLASKVGPPAQQVERLYASRSPSSSTGG